MTFLKKTARNSHSGASKCNISSTNKARS